MSGVCPGRQARPSRFLLFWSLLLVPSVALACPACAGSNSNESSAAFYGLGAMLLLPLLLGAGIVFLTRRLRDDEP